VRDAHDYQGVLSTHVHGGLKIVAEEPQAADADIHSGSAGSF